MVGILYDPDPGTSSPVAFLPSDLVVGVADDLRSSNRVVHGWLGVSGTDAPDGGGAGVESVQANGPAAGRLQARPGHRGRQRPARAHHGRAPVPALRPGPRAPPSPSRSSRVPGTKVVDVTLERRPPSMQG